MLKLSTGLKLPVDAATQTFAFIGRKGSGKTYGAGKLTELLIEAGVQVIILDLVGKWWGLRLAADGKSPGIDIAMLGGLRGDIPLEAAGGGLVADALLESGRSAILDISQFSKGGRQEFAYKFGDRIWRLQKGQLNPSPIHLVIEESQLIVPENIPAGGKHDFMVAMYSIYEEIIRLGRNYGIGITMITQRPQSVAKEVLNQAEPLLVFQVTGSHERKAIKEWINHQGMDQSMIDSLASLKKGECWFWSPEWLDELKQIQIEPKWTFDSTATPKVGEKKPKARAIKPLDLTDLQVKMQATIEKAKADDPKELRKKIAELEKQLKTIPAAAADPKAIERAVSQAVAAARRDWAQETHKLQHRLITADKTFRRIIQAAEEFNRETAAAGLNKPPPPVVHSPAPRPQNVPVAPKAPRKPVSDAGTDGDVSLGKCERAILQVLSQFPEGCDAGKLTLLAGYRFSGGFRNALTDLRKAGLIVGQNAGILQITDAGHAMGPFEPLPTGQALIDYWLTHPNFGLCERTILKALVENYPNGMTATELCKATEYEFSGGFRNALTDLRKAGVMTGRNNDVLKASDHLFEGA